MHDPETVAHEIKLPLFGRVINEKTGYRHYPVIAVIWHVDPERRGDEDSCGWFNRKDAKSNSICAKAREIGVHEWTFFFGEHGDKSFSATDAIYAAWQTIAWQVFKRWRMSTQEINEIMHLASWPGDNLRHTVERARTDPEQLGWLFVHVANAYLRLHRPWWDHPRWHVWHWRIQIPFFQDLKRFMFSRCSKCGKRFPWGYAPMSDSWHGTGPRWFKGEVGVYHHECITKSVLQEVATNVSQPA